MSTTIRKNAKKTKAPPTKQEEVRDEKKTKVKDGKGFLARCAEETGTAREEAEAEKIVRFTRGRRCMWSPCAAEQVTKGSRDSRSPGRAARPQPQVGRRVRAIFHPDGLTGRRRRTSSTRFLWNSESFSFSLSWAPDLFCCGRYAMRSLEFFYIPQTVQSLL